VTTINVSEARAALPELLNRVENGEEITITRHGRPVAVLVRPDVLRSRRLAELQAAAERIEDMMAKAANEPLTGPGLSAERAEELVRQIRADRDAR
jgi:prevent-host-death family protein